MLFSEAIRWWSSVQLSCVCSHGQTLWMKLHVVWYLLIKFLVCAQIYMYMVGNSWESRSEMGEGEKER